MFEPRLPSIWTSLYFWFVVIGVALFKVATSSERSRPAMIITAAAAVFAAAAFTEPVVEHFKLGGTSLQYGVAGLIALTGEHAMKWAVIFAQEPRKLLAIWRDWKGGDGKQ